MNLVFFYWASLYFSYRKHRLNHRTRPFTFSYGKTESLFREKSFVGLLVRGTILKPAFFFFFFPLDCLYHGSVSLSTTGRIKGEIHVQHYSFPCSSKVNFTFRVSFKCFLLRIGSLFTLQDSDMTGSVFPYMHLKKIKMFCRDVSYLRMPLYFFPYVLIWQKARQNQRQRRGERPRWWRLNCQCNWLSWTIKWVFGTRAPKVPETDER